MKILLVDPTETMSMHTLSEVKDITGCPAFMPNIALPTLAALVPDDVEVTIIDETIQPIDFDQPWDIVGITGYITDKKRMFEIADEFRRRNQLVAIGGPYASLSPNTVRPHADILFIGEAENTWPQFINDFRNGSWNNEYRASSSVDIHSSPVPAISKLQSRAYHIGLVQTSRGCPFECEFCDVIVYLGRRQRYKAPERIVEELEEWYRAGYRWVFLADDNFTVHRSKAREIMLAVRDWNRRKPEKMEFGTQLSIDIARDSDVPLLDLCHEAGMRIAYIGIETPNAEALREVKKRQNLLGGDLVADVHTIQKRGILVEALMMVGFDCDTIDTFKLQYEFLQRSGAPLVVISILFAPEGTPLEKRMLMENRLKVEEKVTDYLDTNIIPKNMSHSQLINGHCWLWNKLYSPSTFLERVKVLSQLLPESTGTPPMTPQSVATVRNLFSSYRKMGPEFENIPQEVIKILEGKDLGAVGAILIFYKHIVTVLRKLGIWDPTLAKLKEPNFDNEWANK